LDYLSVGPRWRRIVGLCGGVVIADGAATGAIAVAGRQPVDPILGLVALGAVIAAPGVLTLIGLRDRPHLWLAAAIAALPLAFLSFAGLAFPLVPAAVVLGYAWSKRGVLDGARSLAPPVVLVPLLAVLQLAAAAALFLDDDPASWTTAEGGGSTSDVITEGEALVSLAVIAGLLVAGWVLSTPRRSPRRRGLAPAPA
jgi:hypothetical protein